MTEPIAIVGIGCRFPGGADDPDSFWELLAGGVDAISEIPDDRIDVDRYFDPTPRTPGRMTTRWGGFLKGLDLFDADFFGISPREAAVLDPAQRLLMETTWEAFEDATIDPTSVAGQSVGVFVGQWASDFEGRVFARTELTDFHATTGSGRYAASGRLSFLLDSVGPSMTLDTACSSSLVALHLACQSLRSGESSLAIAGGVNLILQPHITIAYSQNGMMAPDGRCKFGDADGDGYVRSEGVGVVLLKTLSRALADGDRVRAVVLGTSVNNDGRESGLMARPSRAGQAAMLRTAYRNAGVEPHDVTYIEAHGTGTRAGDPVEIGALADVLADGRPDSSRCLVGSVKTNIGHTEGAAGVAGLIKTVLALEHATIPPSLHLRNPNPAIPWDTLPFEIPTAPVPWPAADGRPRIAGVSAYGITGTNAHAVVAEGPTVEETISAAPDRATPLVLSAAAPEALRTLARSYAEQLALGESGLGDVCATAARHRAHFVCRAVFVAGDADDLIDRLRRYADGDDSAADATGRSGDRRRVAFVFPGQGGQWVGMGRELLAREPVFAAAIDACDAALPPGTPWTVRTQLEAEPGDPVYRLDEIAVLQPTLVAVELAIAALWRSLGVEPESVVGHSMGEVAAAHFAGALTLEDAMRIICTRSELLQRTSGHGAMALIDAAPNEVERLIARYDGRVVVAVCNSPRSTVVSGDPAAVDEVLAQCQADGLFARHVKVDVASHSAQMDPLVPELVHSLDGLEPGPASVHLYSSVDGVRHPGSEWNTEYWGRNLRQPVMFGDTVARMRADGIDTFVEINAHPTLLPSILQVTPDDPPLAVPSLRRGEGEWQSMLVALGTLWAHGHPVQWPALFPDRSYRRVGLPHYPWQRVRHWSEAAEPVDPAALQQRPRLDEASARLLHVLRWVPAPVDAASGVGDEWLVVGDGVDAEAVCAALAALGVRASSRHDLTDLDSAPARKVVVLPRPEASGFAPVTDVRSSLGSPAGTEPPRFWWVTRGAHLLDGDQPGPDIVEQAATWGTARVIAVEHPDRWGGLIDLDPALPTADQAEALARALVAGDGDDQVALRAGERFALRLDDFEPQQRTRYQFRDDAAYLITGGLGGLAAHLATAMVATGARRLVLLSRTPLPPRREWAGIDPESDIGRRIATVTALEHAGAAVHVLQADVADEAQMATALDTYRAEQWPPIVGVVHAAGVLDSRLVEHLDRATYDRVVRAKLDGAATLERLLPDLELFVACSSVMGFWPPAGMANYAAANAGLDAFVQSRCRRGLPSLSIQWGPWAQVGMLARADERNVEALNHEGVESLAPEQAVACFDVLLGQSEPVVAVLGIDFAAYEAAHRGRPMSIFGDRAGGSLEHDAGRVMARLAEAAPHERRAILQETVADALGTVMKLPAGSIDLRRPFGSLGLDSLMALELRGLLERALERSLPATLAWNYPTIESLAEHLDRLTGADPGSANGTDASALGTVEPTDGPGEAPTALAALTEMSDDDALRALRGSS